MLLYFANSIYFLFLRREVEAEGEAHIRMPDWLKVQSMGEMKKTLLQVIVVLLAVLFLKVGLETQTDLSLALLIIPIGIVAIGVTIKLIDTDH